MMSLPAGIIYAYSSEFFNNHKTTVTKYLVRGHNMSPGTKNVAKFGPFIS